MTKDVLKLTQAALSGINDSISISQSISEEKIDSAILAIALSVIGDAQRLLIRRPKKLLAWIRQIDIEALAGVCAVCEKEVARWSMPEYVRPDDHETAFVLRRRDEHTSIMNAITGIVLDRGVAPIQVPGFGAWYDALIAFDEKSAAIVTDAQRRKMLGDRAAFDWLTSRSTLQRWRRE